MNTALLNFMNTGTSVAKISMTGTSAKRPQQGPSKHRPSTGLEISGGPFAGTLLNEIDKMAWRIENRGLDGLHEAVTSIAYRAASVGISPVLTGVLADATAPDVVRIRAFGKVALALGASNRTPQPLVA